MLKRKSKSHQSTITCIISKLHIQHAMALTQNPPWLNTTPMT
ncbi:hypothetical protein F383_39139 [Gossypium arboreum]|uniref:Uncharacterized protein n=1 Tax=Gossypium arboreum TaxID=29729 RepID=A0A0B0MKJ2_GOSAR|nr:hypothetical protein F383_39139 [Gossypium arboreum]